MKDILVIDDDRELCDLLRDFLAGEGFSTVALHHGPEGAQEALEGDYELVVLDVMLPGMNGFDVLRRIREHSRIPVIMLTARGEDIDRIVGLELGADDYLPKPFNPRELVARIRAVQRRIDNITKEANAELVIGDVALSRTARTVKRGGAVVDLTSVEFNLLEELMMNAGQVVSREKLVQNVLGRRLSAYDRSIDVHVSALRRKLGHAADGMERIRTIRGIGYLYTVSEKNS